MALAEPALSLQVNTKSEVPAVERVTVFVFVGACPVARAPVQAPVALQLAPFGEDVAAIPEEEKATYRSPAKITE